MMVGDWLTADPGPWSPDGVELSYQWFRGDHAVSTATTTRYKLSDADLGQPLTVKVTGRKSGYPVSATSEPTAKAVKRGIHSPATTDDRGRGAHRPVAHRRPGHVGTGRRRAQLPVVPRRPRRLHRHDDPLQGQHAPTSASA